MCICMCLLYVCLYPPKQKRMSPVPSYRTKCPTAKWCPKHAVGGMWCVTTRHDPGQHDIHAIHNSVATATITVIATIVNASGKTPMTSG